MNVDAWEYGILLDLATPTAQSHLALDLLPGTSVGEAAETVRAMFIHDPSVERVMLLVAGVPIGTSSRQRLERLHDHVVRAIGDGDGATLPGEPTSFDPILFCCQKCGYRVYRVHVDNRSMPRCLDGHGELVLESAR